MKSNNDNKKTLSEKAKHITSVENDGRVCLYNARTREVIPGKILSIGNIRKVNTGRMKISFLVSAALIAVVYFLYTTFWWSFITYASIGAFVVWMLIYALFVNDSVPVGLLVRLDSGMSIRMNTLEDGLSPEISYTDHKVRMEMIQGMQEPQG